MKKKFADYGIIAIVAVMLIIFSACEGPEGIPGGKGPEGPPPGGIPLVVDLDVENPTVTIDLGRDTTLTAQVNSDALIQTLIWELADGAADIIRINRAPRASGRFAMVSGNSVIVTGIAAGEAKVIVTAPGTGGAELQRTVTVNVQGLAARLDELPAKVTASTFPVKFEFTAYAGGSISPQVFEFPELETASETQVEILIKGGAPGVVMSLDGIGSMFRVGNGVSLTLENITLQGVSPNNRALVIVDDGGELIIDRVTITGNNNILSPLNIAGVPTHIPNLGSGVRVEEYGKFTMIAGEISGNTGAWGGGVLNFGTFTMHDGAISDNFAPMIVYLGWGQSGQGGGVRNFGTFTMYGGEISGNAAMSNLTNQGGGGLQTDGTFIMHNGRISDNDASHHGGGVHIGEGGFFEMRGGTISGNTTNLFGPGGIFFDSPGGGVHITGGDFEMHGGKIIGNIANTEGGGVNIAGGSTFVMYNGVISENIANLGGGVNAVNNTSFTIHDGEISNNTARVAGGGVRVAAGANAIFTMHDGEISGNRSNGTAAADGGGGVMILGHFRMFNGQISGNTSATTGGGVRLNAGGTFVMNNGVISGNTATTSGGGVQHLGGTGQFRMVNGIIYGNEVGQELRNNAPTSGAAFFLTAAVSGAGVAQHGTWIDPEAGFAAINWTSEGNLATIDTTVEVEDGDLKGGL